MMTPTSARLSCRAIRAMSSCSRCTTGTSEKRYARRKVAKSVRRVPSTVGASVVIGLGGEVRLTIACDEDFRCRGSMDARDGAYDENTINAV